MKEDIPRSIVSVVEVLPLSSVMSHLFARLDLVFTEKEKLSLVNKPPRTIVGRLALKRAICKLATEHLGAQEIDPADIEIAALDSGAPRIEKVSGPEPRVNAAIESRVCVSISHSRLCAVGLATLDGKRPNDT